MLFQFMSFLFYMLLFICFFSYISFIYVFSPPPLSLPLPVSRAVCLAFFVCFGQLCLVFVFATEFTPDSVPDPQPRLSFCILSPCSPWSYWTGATGGNSYCYIATFIYCPWVIGLLKMTQSFLVLILYSFCIYLLLCTYCNYSLNS